MLRVLTPEILDELPVDDPSAVRSRRDLRLINVLMGNHRWLTSYLRGVGRITEIGAGDGTLLRALYQENEASLAGVDFVPRPESLPAAIGWTQGDIFLQQPFSGTVVANMFLHHFDIDQLTQIGELISQAGSICVCEPHRSALTRMLSLFLIPLVNDVTRHDMRVSIEAGFRRGELPRWLGLDPERWEITEHTTLLGAYHFSAKRIR